MTGALETGIHYQQAIAIGVPEALLILAVVTLFFGGKKIPEVAEALGKAIKNFRKASQEPDSLSPSEEEGEKTDKEATKDS